VSDELALTPIDDRPESPAPKPTTSILQEIPWTSVAEAVLEAVFTKSLSIRLGNGTLTASENGAPVHLTVASVLAAVVLASAGVAASIQVGSVLLTWTPFTNP
jgi:hypothetical protein